MLTFLSSPKPFKGNDKENQYRAIRSWLLAAENAEVILYGDSPGIEEAGRELGVQIVKNIQSSSTGVPYFNAIVEHAAVHGKYDIQIYLNCDILLFGILSALKPIRFQQFLLIGERIEMSEGALIDINETSWRNELRKLADKGGVRLHGPTGIDYFAFRRGMWQGLPPVIIGRAGYDNALLVYCMKNHYPIIDGTFSVLALHQFHKYEHVVGGLETVFLGKEAFQNFAAVGSRHSATSVSDASYILRGGRIWSWPCRGDRLRSLELEFRYVNGWQKLSLALRLVWRFVTAFHLCRPRYFSLEQLLMEHECISDAGNQQ